MTGSPAATGMPLSYIVGRPIALITSWGTMPCIDPASREVRHEPQSVAPPTVWLITEPSLESEPVSGWLVHGVGEGVEPIVCGVDKSFAAPNVEPSEHSLAPTQFEVVSLGSDKIGLKSEGRYLCAEPDGRLTLSRSTCGEWERFGASTVEVAGALAQQPRSLFSQRSCAQQARAETREMAGAAAPATGAATCHDGRFVRRRVIVIHHRGNLANKMLQYMGALAIARSIEQCMVVNVSIPEWEIDIPDDTGGQLFFDNIDLRSWDPFRPNLRDLAVAANSSESVRIDLGDHLLRMEFFLDRQFYQSVFPRDARYDHHTSDKNLTINIRAGDILSGVSHYPLLPIAFYEELVEKTGLKPVFVGQLETSEYVTQLRLRFPDAPFINSRDARTDFEYIRSAQNIVVAVSTFSWLASWLSEAGTIFLPLSGFYNPTHHREVDLLPIDDVRYRFFLFPLNFGLPEHAALEHHQRMQGSWKEISRNQVAVLKNSAPFLRVPRENYDNGLPSRSARGSQITFDPIWYAHEYIDAAMEISEGWFEDPLHHYLEVGRLRGYLPTRPIQTERPIDPSLPNLALGKAATQSSRSQWSRGLTLEDDACHAVNGDPSEEYGFHTDSEQNPWWMVDLGRPASVSAIRIFNRDHVLESIQVRASPLVVEISNDKIRWQLLFATREGQIFGGYHGGRPLVWTAREPIEARFVRISIPRHDFLHLSEVEIFGLPI